MLNIWNNQVRSTLKVALLMTPGLTTLPSLTAASPGLYCDFDRCVLEIHDSLSFEAAAGGVFDLGGSIEMSGDVVVHTPAGPMNLLEADLTFEPRPDLPEVPFELYGSAMAPFPSVPLFGGASFSAQPLAAVGLVARDTLKEMLENEEEGYTLPLAENPKDPAGDPTDLREPLYLFFHFETGLAFDMPLGEALGFDTSEHDPFGFSVPGDKSVTFVLDPTEPYFYLSQNAREILLDKAQKAIDRAYEANLQRAELEAGMNTTDNNSNGDNDANNTDQAAGGSVWPDLGEVAFSWLGGIPFEPESTWGLPDDVGHFKGQLYVETTLPLYKFVEINGTIVTYAGEHGFEQAGNGEVQVTFDLIPNFLNFSFPLGNASAGFKVTDEEQFVYFSGINDPDTSFLPSFIPFVPSNATQVAGYISTDNPEDARIYAQGQFGYDTENLRRLTGIDLSNLMVNTANLSIDKNGFRLQGRTSSSIHPSIQLGGSVEVDAYFSPLRPQDSYLKMTGEMVVAGVGLKPASVSVGASGLIVEGQFVTPLSSIGMTGSITAAGPSLSGEASVIFSLDSVTKAIEAARAEVIAAQKEVDRLQGAITYMRNIVSDERERDAAKIAKARADVESAQAKVNSLQSSINYHNGRIAAYKRAISSKYSWYKRQKWYNKTWAWGVYAAYRTAKTAQIAYHGSIVGGLYTAKATAQAALLVVQEVLKGAELAATTLPIDLDPRVAALIVSKETATAALKAAELALPRLPDIDADFRGLIDMGIDITGIHGTLSADLNGVSLAQGEVNFGLKPKACVDIVNLGSVCAPF